MLDWIIRCIQLTTVITDNAVIEHHEPRSNIIMVLIFPQGLWTSPLSDRSAVFPLGLNSNRVVEC